MQSKPMTSSLYKYQAKSVYNTLSGKPRGPLVVEDSNNSIATQY